MTAVTTLLKVLVGSRAHGLHGPESDYDYRGVFLHPTCALLSLGDKPRDTAWVEGERPPEGGKVDDTAWEVGHFLALATHCNPTILEVFAAPVVAATEDGHALRTLLPCVWHPKGVRDAFVGYGLNQRKKFLEGKDARPTKYAIAYLRVLCQAVSLLETGVLPVDMRTHPEYLTLRRWKRGEYGVGEVIDACLRWQASVEIAAERCKHSPDLATVNAFLLDVRQRHW